MRFTFPHLHGNKFSGLFNYKLSFQLGKPEGFCFGQRTERADPIGGWEAGRKVCQAHLVLHLYLLHCLWPSPRSSPRPVSRVLGLSVWLMFPPQGFKGAPVASEVRACSSVPLWSPGQQGWNEMGAVVPTGHTARGCSSLTAS